MLIFILHQINFGVKFKGKERKNKEVKKMGIRSKLFDILKVILAISIIVGLFSNKEISAIMAKVVFVFVICMVIVVCWPAKKKAKPLVGRLGKT